MNLKLSLLLNGLYVGIFFIFKSKKLKKIKNKLSNSKNSQDSFSLNSFVQKNSKKTNSNLLNQSKILQQSK